MNNKMIHSITFDEVSKNSDYTDYIFGCEVTEEFFTETGLYKEENLLDAFSIWVTVDCENNIAYALCNEDQELDYIVPINVKQQLIGMLEKENLI